MPRQTLKKVHLKLAGNVKFRCGRDPRPHDASTSYMRNVTCETCFRIEEGTQHLPSTKVKKL